MNDWIWIYLVLIMALWNIATFALYGIDKRKAMKSKRRISEQDHYCGEKPANIDDIIKDVYFT